MHSAFGSLTAGGLESKKSSHIRVVTPRARVSLTVLMKDSTFKTYMYIKRFAWLDSGEENECLDPGPEQFRVEMLTAIQITYFCCT